MPSKQTGNLYLVRHGEAESNTTGTLSSFPEQRVLYHLTETGRRQVEAVARMVASADIERIFSSPMMRTLESASILSGATGIAVEADVRLRETGFGSWEGHDFEVFLKQYPSKEMRLHDIPEEGIEGFVSIRGRLLDFYREHLAPLRGQNVIIVSHGDVLQTLHGMLIGLSADGALHAWDPRRGECKIVSWDEVKGVE